MSFSISSSDAQRPLSLFVAAVIGIVILVFGASEWLVRSQIVVQDDFRANARLLERSSAPDAIFGDSHAARGLVPVEGMVNLAYPSEGIEQMGWKIRTYYADKNPGRVIVQADPHLFAPYRLAREFGDYSQQLDMAATKPGWWPEVLIPRYRSILVNYWSSFFRSGGNLQSRIKVLDNGAMLSPGNLAKVDERLRLFRARQRIAIHKIRPLDKIETLVQEYRDILDFLKNKGATVCMLIYPLSPDYIAALDSEQTRAEKQDRQAVLKFFNTEAKRVGARLVDLRTRITDRNDFRDVDHLNGDAALRYSPGFIDQCFG